MSGAYEAACRKEASSLSKWAEWARAFTVQSSNSSQISHVLVQNATSAECGGHCDVAEIYEIDQFCRKVSELVRFQVSKFGLWSSPFAALLHNFFNPMACLDKILCSKQNLLAKSHQAGPYTEM
jgi:hypothetical protein